MTQRNPMNERNTSEDGKKGVTRKSASAAKPKREAAASVHIAEKTPQQKKAAKKAAQKAEDARQRELDRKYYNPPTQEYKHMRHIWWGVIAGAILLTVLAFVSQSYLPGTVSTVTLIAAYIFIFIAIYIDLVPIRRMRRAYQAEMLNSKAEKKAEKAEKAAAAKKAAEKAAAKEAGQSTEKKGFFSRFGKKDKPAEQPADTKK